MCRGCSFMVCPKADAIYPIVSAASIVAKVRPSTVNEHEQKELVHWVATICSAHCWPVPSWTACLTPTFCSPLLMNFHVFLKICWPLPAVLPHPHDSTITVFEFLKLLKLLDLAGRHALLAPYHHPCMKSRSATWSALQPHWRQRDAGDSRQAAA